METESAAARRSEIERSPSPRRALRWVGRVLVVLGWAIVVALLLVALLRLVAWDADRPLIFLNAGDALTYAPAWLVLIGALLGRRGLLALAALVVVAAQLAFVAPELLEARPLPTWSKGAPVIRLLDANVENTNVHVGEYAAIIRRLRPDLVTFEEATPASYARLKGAGAFAHLPHRFEVSVRDPFSFVIASRYPLVDVRTYLDDNQTYLVSARLETPAGIVRLWVVHTVSPISSDEPWLSDLHRVAAMARRLGTSHLLVAGDFNSTWGNKGFRQILDTGLTDGAAARGEPFQMTWSQDFFFPPFVRFDHVLVGSDLSVTSIATGYGPGSDHRYVFATVALRPDRFPSTSSRGKHEGTVGQNVS